MSSSSKTVSDQSRAKIRSVVFALFGVAASFTVYFIVAPPLLTARFRTLLTTGLALLAVEQFEATDGFGVMGNVYDGVDFVANIVGVGLALVADVLTRGITNSRPEIKAAA